MDTLDWVILFVCAVVLLGCIRIRTTWDFGDDDGTE